VAGVPARLNSCADVNVGYTVLLNPAAFQNNSPYQIPTASPTIPDFRGCGAYSEDLAFIKRFILTEKLNVQFRSEFYNILNRHKFADPSASTNNPGTFGKIYSVDSSIQPRTVQFAVKVEF